MQVSKDLCQSIICGEITQDEAGPEVLYACSQAGLVGAYVQCSPRFPVIAENTGAGTPNSAQVAASTVVRQQAQTLIEPIDLIQPMPTIVPQPPPVPDPCWFEHWVSTHPELALLAVGAVWLMLRKK